jgi:carboxyl-terminal processing protease
MLLGMIRDYYPGEYSMEALVEGAAKGMMRAIGDPYSDYLTPTEYEHLMSGLSGGFGGLGIYIDSAADGYIVIVAPIKGTPAERAGLRPGDKIATVDGEDFRYVDVNSASARLRGEPGTMVRLGIMRQGVNGLIEVDIERAWIEIDPVEERMLDRTVGYLRLSTFNDNATAEVDRAIAELRRQGAKGIVLDLRNNGGGLLQQAISIAERFVLPGQVILSVHSKGGRPEPVVARPGSFCGMAVVVLVNSGTASAAEILAGAIAGNNMGVTVGTQTYGKGAIQNIWALDNGGGLKLTTALYATPKGELLEGAGITPDVIVDADDGLMYIPMLDWYRNIRHMRVGLDVLELQEVLLFLGYARGTADGFYGWSWVQAVRRFQQERGMAVTGEVGQGTAEALNQAVQDMLANRPDVQLDRAVEVLRAKLGH